MSDLAHLRDCRSCIHNSYRHIADCDFVSCCHPVTLERGPRWQKGDPAMVNWRTADVHVREMHQLGDCPTWEAIAANLTPAQWNRRSQPDREAIIEDEPTPEMLEVGFNTWMAYVDSQFMGDPGKRALEILAEIYRAMRAESRSLKHSDTTPEGGENG